MDKINKLESVHSFTVMPKDCNFNLDRGTNRNRILFGGTILFNMDFAGAKVARRACYGIDADMVVTASMDKVNFDKPAYLGDIVTYIATIKALGRSSIHIRVSVKREDDSGNIEKICSSSMTFVTIKDNKPFKHGLTFNKLEGKQE
jgi:acyl-CoA hydrolase